VLEGFEVGRRLGRGRTYARQGQVIELELEKVTAMVQGSRDAPYLVRMRFSMLSSTDWKKVMRACGEDPALGGPLFVGEMPDAIEEAFREQELSLFPTASGDLKAACSCPDQANPCKHVAAVYYLLAQEFDRDPFLIFRLRGMDRTEIAAALADTPAARAAAVPPPPRPTAPSEPPPAPLSEESSQPETADAAEALVEKRALEYVPEPPAPRRVLVLARRGRLRRVDGAHLPERVAGRARRVPVRVGSRRAVVKTLPSRRTSRPDA
jgi:uncharacterized Zn finger protein